MKDLDEMYEEEAELLERQEEEKYAEEAERLAKQDAEWYSEEENERDFTAPVRKKAYAKNYESICHELGFRPECRFVKITTRNTISFTLGKPDEIRHLYKAILDHGYIPAKDLVERIETL